MGTSSWQWFYLGPSNWCRVTKSYISSTRASLGFRKLIRLFKRAAFLAPLGSSAWFTHFIIESGDRLAHWVAMYWRSEQLNDWPDNAQVPQWVRRICLCIIPWPCRLSYTTCSDLSHRPWMWLQPLGHFDCESWRSQNSWSESWPSCISWEGSRKWM